MKHLLRFLIAMLLVSIVLSGYAQEDDLVVLKKLNARFIHNYVTNDVASHDQIIHPSFVCITREGAWVGREAYLKAWATGFTPPGGLPPSQMMASG